LRQIDHLIGFTLQAGKDKSLAKIGPAIDEFITESRIQGFYNHLRYPNDDSLGTTSRVILRVLRAETERSLTLAAIALKRYQLRHGKVPENLSVLVPEFLPAVPIDYMNGTPLKYRPHSDGTFALYSVGEDTRDDGGDGSLAPESATGGSSILALSGSRNRKDLLWPEVASPADSDSH